MYVALLPFVPTEPATSFPPPLNLKVSVVRVEPFMYIENVAVMAVFVPTLVAPLDGLTEVITVRVTSGGVSSGGGGVGGLSPDNVTFLVTVSNAFIEKVETLPSLNPLLLTFIL